MKRQWGLLGTVAIVAMLPPAPVLADTLKTAVAFNDGIGKATASQPAGGMEVAYQITLEGGDLDGCTVGIVEALHGRDEGAWGIFDIAGDLSCADAGFSYTSSGAWDGNGCHAAGEIVNGSGHGAFEGVRGRIAQLGGGAAGAGNGTYDISYDLMVDCADN